MTPFFKIVTIISLVHLKRKVNKMLAKGN